MKEKQLQTKRQTKKGFRKFHAKVTSSRRKQRVSAAANPEMLDSDVPNASIGRALTVILLLHVVAISAVYIGVQWNKDKVKADTVASVEAPASVVDLSSVNANLPTKFVLTGDTYETFAARHNVDVAELRRVNGSSPIHAGKPLSIPPKKIQVSPLATTTVTDRPALPTSNTVVQAQTETTPAPLVVKPMISKAQSEAQVSGKTHTVKAGDTVWRISHKYKVSQDSLMKVNGMKDARHLRLGATLKIPTK